MRPADTDVTRQEMRLSQRQVEHRFLGEFQRDIIFGAAVIFERSDAFKETDALGRMH